MRCPQPNETLTMRSLKSRCSLALLVTLLMSIELSSFTVASRWLHDRCLREREREREREVFIVQTQRR